MPVGSVRRTKSFCRKYVTPEGRYHKDSFRVIKPNPDTIITLGCPRKKWNTKTKRCKVPMKVQSIGKRHKGKSCPTVMKGGKR